MKNAARAGIRVVTAKDVVVRGNVISGSGKWGVLTGFAPRVRVLSNESYGTNPQTNGEHGIYVGNSNVPDDAPVICGNDCHDNWANGIQINGDCEAGGDGKVQKALVAANRVHKNGQKGLSMISAPEVQIVNNLIWDNGTRNQGAGGIHMTRQPACPAGDASSNGVIVNATDAATNNIIFNNVFIGKNTAYADDGGNVAMHNTQAVMPASFAADLKPIAGNPAIGAGVMSFMGKQAPAVDISGAMRPNGALDQGAWEVP